MSTEALVMAGAREARSLCAIAALLSIGLSEPRPVSAQTLTTGTISGTVVDQQGAVLPGVTISALHQPTGTEYSAVTDGQGRFQIPNVRVGGPYAVAASLSGFKDQNERGLNVALGEDRAIEFKMPLATVTETVVVTAQTPLIDVSRAGTAANVGK